MDGADADRLGAQRIRKFLIPTTTKRYQDASGEYKTKCSEKVDKLRKYADSLQEILETARNARLRVAQSTHQLQFPASETTVTRSPLELTPSTRATLASLGPPQEHLVLRENIEMTNVIRDHLNDVEQDIREIKYLHKTQATLDHTKRYRGLQDWAESLLQTCSVMISNLITLSIAGAGLVYATSFGAVRGNVGLMAFTFPLFTIGFTIPAIIQTALKLAATQPRDTPFASQTFWTAVIVVSLLFSVLSVMAAITILNVTIFLLHSNESNGVSRVSGILAFAFCSSIFLLLLLGFCLAIVAKGFKWVFRHLTHTQKVDELEDLEKYAFA